MKDIYEVLTQLEIPYEKHEHPAVFTVEESKKYDKELGNTAHSKNLFLKNKKGDTYYLIVMLGDKRLDLKTLETVLNEKRLSFGSPEKMMEYLGLTPGSVSPFGLIHDTNHTVHVVIDNELIRYEKQGYHPNINTATLVITTEDFQKFLNYMQNTVDYLDLK